MDPFLFQIDWRYLEEVSEFKRCTYTSTVRTDCANVSAANNPMAALPFQADMMWSNTRSAPDRRVRLSAVQRLLFAAGGMRPVLKCEQKCLQKNCSACSWLGEPIRS